jgi:multiple antibiotic resistance protein
MHAGFGMIVPRVVATPDEQAEAQTKADISFSPMALPLVAGPGAIGVVIGLAARNPAVLDRVAIAAASVVIAVVVALVLRYGTPLVDKLGPTGIGALTRVMGFLILAIGVELAIHGVLAAVPPL